MSQEAVQLTPAYAPAEVSAEPTVFSVPVVAFPKTYNYAQQWAIGLIIAGMMKQAKYERYASPFVETFVALKEAYRAYRYKYALHGADAWNAWFTKFELPALKRLGRPNANRTR